MFKILIIKFLHCNIEHLIAEISPLIGMDVRLRADVHTNQRIYASFLHKMKRQIKKQLTKFGILFFYSYLCTRFKGKGKFQSGQMGQTVNLLSLDFGGSNPSLPTIKSGKTIYVSPLFILPPPLYFFGASSLITVALNILISSTGRS